MNLRFLPLLVWALVGCDSAAARPQDPAQAESLFRAGEYDRAIAAYRRAAEGPGAARARRGLMRALAEVGRYADAEEEGRRLLADSAQASEIANVMGEVLARQGKLVEAEARFRQAAGASSDSLIARLNLAVLNWNRGRQDAALADFDRFIDVYNQSPDRLSSEELAAVATAVTYLGRRDPQLFKDALRALDRAIAADSGNLDARVQSGELFLEKYNSADARETFAAILTINPRHPGALLGMARQLQFDGQPRSREYIELSLGTNPNYVPARVALASHHLDGERYDEARIEAERALAVDSTSLEALAVLAAVFYLKGDEPAYESTRRRALARNPAFSEMYETLAELSARHRRYGDAVAFARQGAALDSTAWRAWGLIGINQLRTAELADARRNLEISFEGDPYNVWIKNTLDLLDTHAQYKESESPRFKFLVERKESPLLEPYLAELGEDAYRDLSERYGYRPPAIRLEMYRRHADFSVRTAGLPGFGALGVSFGNVLAMDSPGARERGEFNWGSTAWHEITHTFTLGVTNNRIPRWLAEGLSVLEERRTGRGWGAHASLDFLLAYKQGKLLPVSRLNEGFINPTYPAQVIHSYYQASLVAEMIELEWGWEKMRALLAEYGRDRGTEAAFRAALGISLAELDRRFDEYFKRRFAGPLTGLDSLSMRPPANLDAAVSRARRAPDDLVAQLVAGRLLVAAERGPEALPFLERAKMIFPEYGGADSPYRLLAQVYRERDPGRAVLELTRYTELAETDYDANIELAGLLQQLGDTAGTIAALERTVWIHPYDPAVHQRLAVLLTARKDWARATRERSAVVALDPVDRPEALYQLALAEFASGDMASARRSVLAALDLAPSFELAQTLLLQIRRASPRSTP